MNDMNFNELGERLAKVLINPPNARVAVEMIERMEMLHVSAIAGMLNNTVYCQHSLDTAYELAKDAGIHLTIGIEEILEILATAHHLKAKGEPTSHNEQLTKDIIKEMEQK